MKAFVVLAVLVTCVCGSRIPKIIEKLVPSFTSDFVIKGHDAIPHAAPYIVSLSRTAKHSHICGGSLIDKEFVLTAAHCIPNGGPKGMVVVAGLHDQSKIDNRTQSGLVDWGKVHEDYTGGVGPFDIAILHISEPFEFNEYVQPIILPAHNEIHSGEIHLYGWGQPSPYNLAGAKILQTVETQILPYEECKTALPETAPLHDTNVCSDSLQKKISACNGDSGGPLVAENGKLFELVGIVSWGYVPCGNKNLPSIYTRVSAHKGWIGKSQSNYYSLAN